MEETREMLKDGFPLHANDLAKVRLPSNALLLGSKQIDIKLRELLLIYIEPYIKPFDSKY